MSAREWALTGLEVPIGIVWCVDWQTSPLKCAETLALTLMYGESMHRMCSPRKVKRVEDLEGLAQQWVEMLVTMSTAHDHEARSRMDYTTDDLMRPLLTAPIAQVRQFTRMVAQMLEADPRVPFLVWSSFKKVVEPLVAKGADGEAIQLQELLAVEVANLVVPQLPREELVKAIAGALQWRTPETLAEVKQALEAPSAPKAKLTGRQSCLFLDVPKADGSMARVVL